MEKRIFTIKADVKSKEEIEETILAINNCEFCNAGEFQIELIDFEVFKKNGSTTGEGKIEITFSKETDINSKLDELFYCEFCKQDVKYFIIS